MSESRSRETVVSIRKTFLEFEDFDPDESHVLRRLRQESAPPRDRSTKMQDSHESAPRRSDSPPRQAIQVPQDNQIPPSKKQSDWFQHIPATFQSKKQSDWLRQLSASTQAPDDKEEDATLDHVKDESEDEGAATAPSKSPNLNGSQTALLVRSNDERLPGSTTPMWHSYLVPDDDADDLLEACSGSDWSSDMGLDIEDDLVLFDATANNSENSGGEGQYEPVQTPHGLPERSVADNTTMQISHSFVASDFDENNAKVSSDMGLDNKDALELFDATPSASETGSHGHSPIDEGYVAKTATLNGHACSVQETEDPTQVPSDEGYVSASATFNGQSYSNHETEEPTPLPPSHFSFCPSCAVKASLNHRFCPNCAFQLWDNKSSCAASAPVPSYSTSSGQECQGHGSCSDELLASIGNMSFVQAPMSDVYALHAHLSRTVQERARERVRATLLGKGQATEASFLNQKICEVAPQSDVRSLYAHLKVALPAGAVKGFEQR